MSCVFVTGGAGFIGSHLVNRLTTDKHDVVIYDNLLRRRSPTSLQQNGNVHFVLGDLRDYCHLREAIANSEIVFHLGAQSNVICATNDLDYCISTNIFGTYNLLKASKEAGVKRIVFTSSREVYGEVEQLPVNEDTPLKCKNLYGYSKVAGENFCHLFSDLYNLPVVILRLSNVYGPGDTGRVIPIFIERACSGAPLVVYGGKQIIDFVWIDQVVEALMKAMLFPLIRIPINIGSGRGIPILDLAHSIIDLTHSSSYIELSPERKNETKTYIADITRMKEILSIRSFEDLQAGLSYILNLGNLS
jgi:UDP-glucose 4-epimerase